MKPILNQSARKEMAKAVTDCTLNFGKRKAEDFVAIIEQSGLVGRESADGATSSGVGHASSADKEPIGT